jgi:hypothetical protein
METINMDNKKYGIDYQVPKYHRVCCCCDKLILIKHFSSHKITKEHDRNVETKTRPRYLEYK